jgi:hypothetical protein
VSPKDPIDPTEQKPAPSTHTWSTVGAFSPRLVRIGEVTHTARGLTFVATDCGVPIEETSAKFLRGGIDKITCPACRKSLRA